MTTFDKDHPFNKDFYDFITSKTAGNQNYVIVSDCNNVLNKTVYRTRPCYGEMRPYHKTHPKEVNDGVYMPGDLHVRFPDGNPVAVAVRLSSPHENRTKFFEFMASEESPYSAPFKEVEFVRDSNKDINGFILRDTNYNPTILVNLLIMNRSDYSGRSSVYKSFIAEGANPLEALVLNFIYGKSWLNSGGYDFDLAATIKRLFGNNPVNNSVNHENFFDRAVYNRPYMPCSFNNQKDESFETLLEFGSSKEFKAANSPSKALGLLRERTSNL